MEPRIQYAQTGDGVSIAYYTLGEGLPLVVMPNVPFGHLQMEWQIPEYRDWHQRLAEKMRVIRYDARGHGLSDRQVSEYSLDLWRLDLEAVVDRLGLEKFALMAAIHSGPVGIAYAVRHPERVSHLILWSTYARAVDYARSPQLQTLRGLVSQDWELYTETVAHAVLGWSAGEPARQFASLMREAVAPEAARAAFNAASQFDVAALLPLVKCPTLVLHRRQYRLLDVDVARGLASRIPNARLALLEGDTAATFLGDAAAVVGAIDEFLSEGEEAAGAEAATGTGMVTILFTDMEGSTSLTQRLGDAKAQEVLRTHNSIIRDALNAHGGAEIKHTGDGIMASFASASRALDCAIRIQRAFEARNASLPAHPEALEGRAEPQPSAHGSRTSPRADRDVGAPTEAIRVRIGLNAGEPVAEERDLFGTAVQLAARICAQAEPGQILAPIVVRELAAGKPFLFSDRGETALRGFEDPVRLYEVRWGDEG